MAQRRRPGGADFCWQRSYEEGWKEKEKKEEEEKLEEMGSHSVNTVLLQGGRGQGPSDKEEREAWNPFHEAIPGYARYHSGM